MIDKTPIVYACKNRDETVRKASTSGGVFTALSEGVFQNNGVVLAVRFDSQHVPIYDFIENISQIDAFRGSKYVQANITREIMSRLEDYLSKGTFVMVVGTPCFINGLSVYFGSKYANLILVDFICMGIAPPKIWKTYVSATFVGEKIKKITFKDKIVGWRNYSFVVETDKRKYQENGKSNLYMKGYLNKLYLRPSCYKCICKGYNRASDITIADCWGIEEYSPEFDDDKGISSVFINNTKGEKIFETISESVDFIEIPFSVATVKNHYYFDCAEENYYSDLFFREFSRHPSLLVMDKYKNRTRPIWIKIMNKIKKQ